LNSSSSSLESLDDKYLDSGEELFSPFHKTKLEAKSQFFEALDITQKKEYYQHLIPRKQEKLVTVKRI
jgi:hypothetical protein